MNLQRFLLSLLLSFSVVSSLLGAVAYSQALTTMTTTTTAVTLLSNTNTQSTPLATYATTNSFQSIVVSTSWIRNGVDPRHCLTDYFSFVGHVGQSVSGTISANQDDSLTVYLLSDAQFSAWRSSNYCDPGQAGIGVQWFVGSDSSHVKTATVSWTSPADGKYWFLVETFSNKSVVISMSLSTQGLQTSTVVLYSTVFSIAVYSLTQTYTSELVQQLQQQAAAGPGSNSLPLPIIIAVAAIAIIGIAGYFVMKRRKAK